VDVLVVEDDEDVRDVVQLVLRAEELEVVAFANGVTALSWLLEAQEPPRLILLDVEMPVMNGSQLLAVLDGHPRLSDVPVVVMTASPAPPASRTIVALLSKPSMRRPSRASSRASFARAGRDPGSTLNRRITAALVGVMEEQYRRTLVRLLAELGIEATDATEPGIPRPDLVLATVPFDHVEDVLRVAAWRA
jgi:two-component system, OmpR family, response regulator CpxR